MQEQYEFLHRTVAEMFQGALADDPTGYENLKEVRQGPGCLGRGDRPRRHTCKEPRHLGDTHRRNPGI